MPKSNHLIQDQLNPVKGQKCLNYLFVAPKRLSMVYEYMYLSNAHIKADISFTLLRPCIFGSVLLWPQMGPSTGPASPLGT